MNDRLRMRLRSERRRGISEVLPAVIGGVTVGAAGGAGTIYEGYSLSWGDEFDALDIMRPSNSRGKYFTTRTYLAGARGSDTLLGTMQDTDPFWTGHNDKNRGVAVGYDNMRVASSVLEIQARKATAPEIEQFEGSGRLNVAGMISGAGAINFYPSTKDAGDIILEWRQKWSAKAGNPAGWHPTLWMQSSAPTPAINSDEVDIEGNSQGAYLHRSVWTSGSASVSSVAGQIDIFDNAFHTVTMVLNQTEVLVYIDGVLTKTGAFSANTKNKPSSFLITNHLYNQGFEGESYSAAAWAADADGATMATDWVRVWRRAAQQHFAPLVNVADANIAFGGTVDIVLPSALSLWGDAGVTEYLQSIMTEENEPGASHSTSYTQFPAGVTYNAGTRTLTVAPSDTKAGRLNFALMAYKTTGSTCEPLRFSVNVGPVVNLADTNIVTGATVSIDAYALCDCGVLVSNGAGARAKTVTVSGLAGSGLSYNDTTGLITGTAVAGTYSVTLSTTNSIGQSASATKTFTVAAAPSAYAYESWTGPGWFDASDDASYTLSGSNVVTLANKRAGGGNLTGGGTASGRQKVAGAQNGRAAIRVVRDVSTVDAPPRLSASTAALVSAVSQGTDKPYTMLAAYTPTDTNTGFIAGWSDTVGVGESQQIELIRRSATASSVRRGVTTATPMDVNFGAGQASGTPRIVAIKHTGFLVDVWDTSLTKLVTAASQNANAFNTELAFHLFAAETGSSADPSFAQTQCNMDFYECIVVDSAMSDAAIQQAIADLSTKWGITLT